MTPQEVITVKNLFQDYKDEKNDGSERHKRSHTAFNYTGIKNDRVMQMTKKSVDPKMSLTGDPATGIVGKVPQY